MANIYKLLLTACILLYYCAEITEQVGGRKVKREVKTAEEKGITYLQQYGYYQSWVTKDSETKRALIFLQTFADLKITGKFNQETYDQMKVARCGHSDPLVRKTKLRQPFYAHATKWKKVTITWYWDGITTNKGMSKEDIRDVFDKSFDVWQKVSKHLLFEEVFNHNADIVIKFATKIHDDPFPFDGVGHMIAHAFYPYTGLGFGGDIHFDDDEIYTLNSTADNTNINFRWITLHEIGHSLGIMHSHDRNSIMYPWYNKTHPILALHDNDINAVRYIYPPNVK